jgi:ABC-type sugar transport system permease subunit
MPLVLRVLLIWSAISVVVSPVIGMMLAAGSPDTSRLGNAQRSVRA